MTIVSIGEILWDVFPNAIRLGGAPLNFSAHAARLGERVAFLSAVGNDDLGRDARDIARTLGLNAEYIQVVDGAPTGTVSVQVATDGQPSFTIHRPAAYDRLRLDDELLDQLRSLSPEWVYYGTLYQANPASRVETARLLAALPDARRFFDVNLRRDCWTPELLEHLLGISNVVKLSDDEAATMQKLFGTSHPTLEEFTAEWSARCGWKAVAVTRGARGCVLRVGNDFAECPGFAVDVVDAVGAGDAFAAGLIHCLGRGLDARSAGTFANRLGAVVASRAGAVPEWTLEDCVRVG